MGLEIAFPSYSITTISESLDELIAYVDQRFETDRKDDHRWLYGAASQITDMDQQYQTALLLKKEAEWFATCIDLEEHFDYFFYHGMVLFFLKEREEAKTSFLKAESHGRITGTEGA